MIVKATMKRQRGYQRAEDWEIDQEQERKEMTWEEKVSTMGNRTATSFNRMKFYERICFKMRGEPMI
jgi:hypothetical protein